MTQRGRHLGRVLLGACLLHLYAGTGRPTVPVPAQTTPDVLADSTYDPGDWSATVVTASGAGAHDEQRLSGGNPDAFRYMAHTLPAPPGPTDLTRVEVTHIYEADAHLAFDPIDHIDYAEDVRLLDLPWEQAFIRSYPAIRQSGRVYRAGTFLEVIADTLWHSGSLTGLTADDFFALDGSGDHPDFSDQADFLFFGFWRISTRSATLPPIPPAEDLVYRHGSDNFTVTIHGAPSNQRPVARNDAYLYLDYFFNTSKALPVLENDADPDGDPLRIRRVGEPAFGGTIVAFTDSTIAYAFEEPLRLELEDDFFVYTITDEEDSATAFVNIYFCVCPIECVALFLAPLAGAVHHAAGTAWAAAADTLDVGLFRRFRDDVLLPTETGTRFVDFYYRNAPEAMPLLVLDRPDLGRQAARALLMMQAPLRNLLDGDGSALVTQAMVDSVDAFLNRLKGSAGDALRDTLDVELARLGPLQELVGLPVARAVERALGEPPATDVDDDPLAGPPAFALHQNHPNPFTPPTQITYRLAGAVAVELTVYDILGRQVTTLVDGLQATGEHAVPWDGRDDRGVPVPAGLYFARLRAGAFRSTKAMILVR